MIECVKEGISWSIFNAKRIGNGFNKIMRTGNRLNKVINMYILPSKKEREYCLKQLEHAFG